VTDEKKNPLGPTGSCVQANLARIREARGLTKKELSARVGDLGRQIPPLGISRIEAGTRRVDADDLVALALALNVSPLALLLPHSGTDTIQLTAGVGASFDATWGWASGDCPLDDEGRRGDDRQREDYERQSLPPAEWYTRRHPAGQAVGRLKDGVRQLVNMGVEAVHGDAEDDQFARRLRAVRYAVERLPDEVDRLEADHADAVRFREEAPQRARANGGS